MAHTTKIGGIAESAAAEHLSRLGYKVIARNWKIPSCEIDLIVQKKKQLYFVEVKYRYSDTSGSGMAYITDKKLARMRYAAEVWVNLYRWPHDYALAAVSVSGPDYKVDEVLFNLG